MNGFPTKPVVRDRVLQANTSFGFAPKADFNGNAFNYIKLNREREKIIPIKKQHIPRKPKNIKKVSPSFCIKMAFITFMYQLKGQKRRGDDSIFYGKYVSDYLSDDHEGLDKEAKDVLVRGLNLYRKQKNHKPLSKKDVEVGVIGFSSGDGRVPSYSSAKETKFFDFYSVTEYFRNDGSIRAA